MNVQNEKKLRKLSRDYLTARQSFRKATDNDPLLSGNDNIVGRIGEFIACQFLVNQLKRSKVARNKNIVEQGYDVIADGKMVSVKTITSENIRGRSTRVKSPWDELVLIDLQAGKVNRIGYLERNNLKNHGHDNPVARLMMLSKNGLIGKYGKVYSGKEISNYL